MDVRVDGFYERMLLKLADRYHQPTASAMMRLLIMNAAKAAGLWQVGNELEATEESIDTPEVTRENV